MHTHVRVNTHNFIYGYIIWYVLCALKAPQSNLALPTSSRVQCYVLHTSSSHTHLQNYESKITWSPPRPLMRRSHGSTSQVGPFFREPHETLSSSTVACEMLFSKSHKKAKWFSAQLGLELVWCKRQEESSPDRKDGLPLYLDCRVSRSRQVFPVIRASL